MTFIKFCFNVRDLSCKPYLSEKQVKMLMSEFYLKGKTSEQDIEQAVKRLEE